MADLLSPGVSVTVTDETISSTSGAGTVPLFVIATAQDKLVTGSLSVATGTTKANAGKLQLITSQRNALETYDHQSFNKVTVPLFKATNLTNMVYMHYTATWVSLTVPMLFVQTLT